MLIQPGEYRQARFEGQLRIVKVVCSSSEFPGHWVVEDLISQSQFKLHISAFEPAPLNQTPDAQTPDAQTPDAQTPDVQMPDDQMPDDRTPDEEPR